MKVLHELYQVVGEKSAAAQLKKADQSQGSLTRQFLDLLRDPDLTDEEAAIELYGKKADKSLSKYKALKTRVRDILVAALQSSHTIKPSYRTSSEAYETGLRNLGVVRLLLAKRAWNAAREIARTTFHKVEKYQNILLNRDLTDHVAGMYLGANYNEKLFKKYFELNKYYNEAAILSFRILERYREVLNMTYAHRLPSKEIGSISLAYANEFSVAKQEYAQMPGIQGAISYLEVVGHMYSGSYHKAIDAADQALDTLRNCIGASSGLISFLLMNRLEAVLKLEEFELGIERITEAAEHTPPKSINAIKVSEYAVRLGLKTGNFGYAYLSFVKQKPKLIKRLLTPRHQEYWRILEAYINFLIRAGEIHPEDGWPPLPKFLFRKFFNDVPYYASNKRGMNIPILVLQALYFIIEKKYDKVMDRTSALQRYGSRYLLNDDNIRNNCFFKLLTIVIQANFHKAATLRKAKSTYAKMISDDTKRLAQGNETEIIPYEVLWEILLDHLD